MIPPPQSEPLVRRAGPADALAIADVHVRAWQVAYRGLIEAEFLEALDPEQRAGTYDLDASSPEAPETLVVVEGESVRGFVTFGPSRDADVAAGE
ncbi:MAG TPA: hypothetical protein VFN82_02595, partial [Solirubrobacterales bacterium]|nr:hypothetical protein [Solirubrobacterales bacterium]